MFSRAATVATIAVFQLLLLPLLHRSIAAAVMAEDHALALCEHAPQHPQHVKSKSMAPALIAVRPDGACVVVAVGAHLRIFDFRFDYLHWSLCSAELLLGSCSQLVVVTENGATLPLKLGSVLARLESF